MIERLRRYILDNALCQQEDKILLAVSGGVDSVVMCHLIDRLGFTFSIVHCHFHLRGADADADEVFVRSLAQSYAVPYHVAHFQTKEYAAENGLSIQMAARELRYDFFDELMRLNGYAKTATAHHLNDVMETFFINLLRGTGISGLHGIPVKTGTLIRPLLLFTRAEIAEYSLQNNLSFREDRSNQDTKYLRNKIRKEIVPCFSGMKPGFERIMQENVQRLSDVEQIYRAQIALKKECLVKPLPASTSFVMERRELLELNPLKTYLFEILRDFSFSEDVVDQLIQNSTIESSGQFFYSHTHRILRNRNQYIIEAISTRDRVSYPIQQHSCGIEKPICLRFSYFEKTADFLIEKDVRKAYLDADQLQYPLFLTHWEKGDVFSPFGMKGKQMLLSDFFNNQKLSRIEKEEQWLLRSSNEVVWIVGRRIHNSYAIGEKTKRICVIELDPMET